MPNINNFKKYVFEKVPNFKEHISKDSSMLYSYLFAFLSPLSLLMFHLRFKIQIIFREKEQRTMNSFNQKQCLVHL